MSTTPKKRMRFLVNTQDIPRNPDSKGLQVIAAGLWRCATSSLQFAFEEVMQPSFAPSMHGAYIMPSIPAMKACYAACIEQDDRARREILHQLFDGYNASSDFPGMAFLDDLLEMYPGAKVILNKRSSAKGWKKSIDGSLRFFSTWTYLVIGFWIPQSYWHYGVYAGYKKLARRRWGLDDIFSEEAYHRHNEWVERVAAEHGAPLLQWEPGMGWEELCQFVGRDLTDKPFPQLNEGLEIAKLKRYLILRGLLAWLVVVAVALTAIYSVTFLMA